MTYTRIVEEDADRVEEVRVHQHPGMEHRERVVHNVGAERRASLWQVTSLLWLAAGLLEALIGMRVLLKLLAANPAAPFAQLVYGLSEVFVWPFLGLTITPSAEGVVLEIPSIIAMIVYALLFLALDRLIWLLFIRPRARAISIYERERS
jgi:hypothetical protein